MVQIVRQRTSIAEKVELGIFQPGIDSSTLHWLWTCTWTFTTYCFKNGNKLYINKHDIASTRTGSVWLGNNLNVAQLSYNVDKYNLDLILHIV